MAPNDNAHRACPVTKKLFKQVALDLLNEHSKVINGVRLGWGHVETNLFFYRRFAIFVSAGSAAKTEGTDSK